MAEQNVSPPALFRLASLGVHYLTSGAPLTYDTFSYLLHLVMTSLALAFIMPFQVLEYFTKKSHEGFPLRPPRCLPVNSNDRSLRAARRSLATIALAVALTPAVFIAGLALPLSGGGEKGGAGIAPAFAELEPLRLKSYSEEFASGLAPVNTVRGG